MLFSHLLALFIFSALRLQPLQGAEPMNDVQAILTLHPWSKQFETAYWIGNFEYYSGYVGRAVLFHDGLLVDPDRQKLETDESKPAPHNWKWKPDFLEGKNDQRHQTTF